MRGEMIIVNKILFLSTLHFEVFNVSTTTFEDRIKAPCYARNRIKQYTVVKSSNFSAIKGAFE